MLGELSFLQTLRYTLTFFSQRFLFLPLKPSTFILSWETEKLLLLFIHTIFYTYFFFFASILNQLPILFSQVAFKSSWRTRSLSTATCVSPLQDKNPFPIFWELHICIFIQKPWESSPCDWPQCPVHVEGKKATQKRAHRPVMWLRGARGSGQGVMGMELMETKKSGAWSS